MSRVPAIVVFDCDQLLWSPECFQLDGPPFRHEPATNAVFSGRTPVRLFPGALLALQELSSLPLFANTKIALASSTRYPAYSQSLREAFQVSPGVSVDDVVHFREVYYDNKSVHLGRIQSASGGVPFSEMVFFDDDTWGDNTGHVKKSCPGITVCRCPEGLTEALWRDTLHRFATGRE
jgi:magnesium-dependent phosphatase-1